MPGCDTLISTKNMELSPPNLSASRGLGECGEADWLEVRRVPHWLGPITAALRRCRTRRFQPLRRRPDSR